MNSESLALRACDDRDRRFCYDVKTAAMQCYVEPIWGWDEDFQIEFHRKDWEAHRPQIIVLDDRDIGTIEIEETEAEFHLGEFYLFPEFQRQGIGTHFMNSPVSDADKYFLPTTLEVVKIHPIRSLYERFGFEIINETKTHYLMRREPKLFAQPKPRD